MSDRYSPFSDHTPASVGVGYTGLGCSCDPTRGQSCTRCDGTEWWRTAQIPQALPPCMIEEET